MSNLQYRIKTTHLQHTMETMENIGQNLHFLDAP